VNLPQLYRVKQQVKQTKPLDIEAAISSEMARLEVGQIIAPGDSVAITAGSRGIANIQQILKTIVDELKALGSKPFIVPAMGSHAGGTAQGQARLLAGLGITRDKMGCPIRASMEVVKVGQSDLNIPVYLDKYAYGADHIFVVNRVKPHTKFSGKVESGLIKMCLIGLGKREGAGIYHRAIDHYSWDEVVDSVREILLSRTHVKFGLAILENAQEETAAIVGLRRDEFFTREPALLNEARKMMPSLPFEEIDLLIVDEMGKEFSGTGMDTNITGRKPGSAVQVLRIFVRDLTSASLGNAQGIGLADFTTTRLVEKIDRNALYLNSRTAHRTDTCKIPMTFENDRVALEIAMEMTCIRKQQEKRIVWIKNTLELQEILVSQAYLPAIDTRGDLKIIGGPYQIKFDKTNNLVHPLQTG